MKKTLLIKKTMDKIIASFVTLFLDVKVCNVCYKRTVMEEKCCDFCKNRK